MALSWRARWTPGCGATCEPSAGAEQGISKKRSGDDWSMKFPRIDSNDLRRSMPGKRNRLTATIRIAAVGALAVQILLVARGVLTGTRFHSAPGPALVVGLVSVLVCAAAVAILLKVWRPTSRAIRILTVGFAVALTVRFHLAPIFNAPRPLRLAANQSPPLVSFLRQLASAQEQHRLRSGRYSDSLGPLREWANQPAGSIVKLVAREDMAWSAQVSLAGLTCSIWVRDSVLRTQTWQPEGSPTCGTPERRERHEAMPSVLVPLPREVTTFGQADIGGTWLQHRSDARRTGVVVDAAGTPGHSWDARVAGPLRAPVSIAGNQVFVGAHGNGEVVALSLDSGKLGYRLRAPNWVHHEPAVSGDLVIFGFGNNETQKERFLGTDPSGVVAYDRRTGFERWRVYTTGSVMGAPTISDSIVAVSTGGPEAIGIRLRDGVQLWRTPVTGYAPMGNPLLVDSLMIFGVERMSVCAIDTRTGVLAYCARLVDECSDCWGAGHASPALAGDVMLQVFEADSTIVRPTERMTLLLKKALGFARVARLPDINEQILVAFDWRNGKVRWRASIGRGSQFPPGHNAGTPTVVNGVAFIPVASNGHVVAVNTQSGRLLWSAAVGSVRGSVTAIRGSVIAATADTAFVVLDAATGRVRCRQRLRARADRAGLTVAGETGILTLGNGTVMARPVGDWLACRT